MDYDKARDAMEALRDSNHWPYLKEFLDSEIKSTINTIKVSSSDEIVRSSGELKAYDKVLNFVGSNNASNII